MGRAAAPGALRVAFAYGEADLEVATKLAALLRENGVEVVAGDARPAPDGLVVLMSEAAFASDYWLPPELSPAMRRPIPVRIGALTSGQVPPLLARLNWIDWDAARPASTLGFIVTGLLTDPSRHQILTRLDEEAEAWDQNGRKDERLIAERARTRQARKVLADLSSDSPTPPDPITRAFVAASDKATRKTQRRRLLWRGGAIVAAITAVSGVISTVPELQANSRASRAAIVTAGNSAVLDQMPEWSAANAATLMLEGSDAQRALGRSTVVQAMARPWQVSYLYSIDSVLNAASYEDGHLGVVLALTPDRSSGIAIVDPHRGQTLATRHLPRRFERLDVSKDGRLAAVAGSEGAATIELRDGHIHSLTSHGTYVGVRVLGDQVALWTEDGQLELRDADGGAAHPVGDYESVLDVVADPRGGKALVSTAPGTYSIISLPSGATLARGQIPPGEGIGTLSPDGRRAVVDGGDGQLWTFGSGAARPTGIPVPASLGDLAWGSDERLLVVSDSAGGQVYFLPRAELIGAVCQRAPRVAAAWLEPGGEMVACEGDARSFWMLPAAPAPAPHLPAAAPRHLDSPYASIEVKGWRYRLSTRGSLGRLRADWEAPFESPITAAAFSPDDHQLALGSARGSVAVIGISRRGTVGLVSWSDPDGAPIASLRWTSDLDASTGSGQSWQVPTCPHCQTDAGLLATVRDRFSGCFSALQLDWIDAQARERLGLRECAPIESIPGG